MQIHSVPPPGSAPQPAAGREVWKDEHLTGLVIACADGRFVRFVEAFAARHFGTHEFDRLYVPGGPGSMSDAGAQFMRAEQMRREVRFLLERHDTEEVLLIWHGPSEGGPEEALCGHYKYLCSGKTAAEIAELQRDDATDLTRNVFGAIKGLTVRCFRAEVDASDNVSFVELG